MVFVVVSIPSSARMSGCESCSFTFGARTVRARVHVPVGYDEVEVDLDSGLAGRIEWVSPGILEATCLAPECGTDADCGAPGSLRCDAETAACVPAA